MLAYNIRQRALFDAIHFCGSVKRYSELIGASRSQVSNWLADPNIDIDYRYIILTEALAFVSVERLSPHTKQVNQIIRRWKSSAQEASRLSLDQIHIENKFNKYYRTDIFNNSPNTCILVSQDRTLITGYAHWLASKKQKKHHIGVNILDIETLRLHIHTLTELYPKLSITDRATVGAYLELTLGSCQGRRTDLIKPAANTLWDDKSVQPASASDNPILSRKQIANCVGFGNQESYRQAKYVIRHGMAKLLAAMDKKLIAIHVAANIAKQPTEQQMQLLSEKTSLA